MYMFHENEQLIHKLLHVIHMHILDARIGDMNYKSLMLIHVTMNDEIKYLIRFTL